MPNSPSTINRPKNDKARFAERVARMALPNEARLLVLENHATPTVALRGSFLAGSYFEPRDKPGLSSITAEMLERGTQRRSKLEIADQLESVGADINFSAGMFAVSIAGRSLSRDLPSVIETMVEQLRAPAFPADELEKLKQQTAAGLLEQQQSTRYRAYERFTQLIFDPSNPFHIPSGERLIESINSITVEDVRRFYEKQYGGKSLILTVVGDVEAERVKEQVTEAVSGFDGPVSIEINVADAAVQQGSRSETVVIKDKANLDVLLGSAASLRRSAPDYYASTLR